MHFWHLLLWSLYRSQNAGQQPSRFTKLSLTQKLIHHLVTSNNGAMKEIRSRQCFGEKSNCTPCGPCLFISLVTQPKNFLSRRYVFVAYAPISHRFTCISDIDSRFHYSSHNSPGFCFLSCFQSRQ